MKVDKKIQAGEMYVENSLSDCSQLHRLTFKLELNTHLSPVRNLKLFTLFLNNRNKIRLV